MALTNSILNITADDTNEITGFKLVTLDRALWGLDLGAQGLKPGESQYRQSVTDKNYPCTLRIGIYPDAVKDITNLSIKFTTWGITTNADDDVVKAGELTGTLAFRVPSAVGLFSSAELMTIAMLLVSSMFASTTGSTPNIEPSLNQLERWADGVPALYSISL